jgi:SAM-dependent methyltransferase
LNFQQLSPVLSNYIHPNDKILVLGSGNSGFSSDLYLSLCKTITNIDISQVVISKMQEKHHEKVEMAWLQMDMLNLSFENHSFDVLIDKATMDVLQCDNEDCWDPSEEVLQRVSLFYSNCWKVLKNQGKLIQISFDQPHFRRKYINFDIWDLQVRTVEGNTLPYFVYILSKKT